jgi:hypothetical protein
MNFSTGFSPDFHPSPFSTSWKRGNKASVEGKTTVEAHKTL